MFSIWPVGSSKLHRATGRNLSPSKPHISLFLSPPTLPPPLSLSFSSQPFSPWFYRKIPLVFQNDLLWRKMNEIDLSPLIPLNRADEGVRSSLFHSWPDDNKGRGWVGGLEFIRVWVGGKKGWGRRGRGVWYIGDTEIIIVFCGLYVVVADCVGNAMSVSILSWGVN